MLEVKHVSAGYGAAMVLDDVSLTLREGASLAVLGRNGMGKTTLLTSVVGLTRRFHGVLRLGGQDITHLSQAARVKRGLVRTFQINALFPHLTAL